MNLCAEGCMRKIFICEASETVNVMKTAKSSNDFIASNLKLNYYYMIRL
jgi:hypothetical protein